MERFRNKNVWFREESANNEPVSDRNFSQSRTMGNS
ncbi:hypothetical protein BLCOC_41240 [Blautia coccoides]|uniref:Uncharacterized protein n=1 Tax=Blautia producta TaxID=33035 RepID=A0ABZ0UET0_9FIRM|nr:hypothetical protein EV205_104112 [Blautia coccoides]WPX75759.1 hypothetical protein BLCOC_41240 [Blautia coccoides]SUX99597.1 Uncharacterised protein [Blautia coccoides]